MPNYDVDKEIRDGIKKGTIKQFDAAFYSQFNGKYFAGLPIYHYLQKMNMRKCYDTSAILALAMDCNCFISRGELKNLSREINSYFGHGWVEKDGLIYDTTWQIITSKELYYRIFRVKESVKNSADDYFKETAAYTDWTIRDKKYYESEDPISSAWAVVAGAKAVELLRLESSTSTNKEKAYAQKLLNDLPNIPFPQLHTHKR